MQQELNIKKPVLEQKKVEVNELMKDLTIKKKDAKEKQKICDADAAETKKKEDAANAIREDC